MTRYHILNPNITKEKDVSPMDEKKASGNLLDESKLDVSLFRLGHTKARLLSLHFTASKNEFRS